MRLVKTLGNNQLKTLANSILRRVTEDAGGSVVPTDDITRVVGGDDRVDRRLGDRTEFLFGLFALADVPDDTGKVAVFVQEPSR